MKRNLRALFRCAQVCLCVPSGSVRRETAPPRERNRWQLSSCADAGAVGAALLAGCSSQGGRRRASPSLRCLRHCHDSGVAGGSGGGRLDCRLPDRLGAEGEGLGSKAEARGVQGGGAGPQAFSHPSSLLGRKPRGRYPRAPFRVAPWPRGVNKTPRGPGRGVAVCAAAAVALRVSAGPAAFGSCPRGASSGLGRAGVIPHPAALHLGGKLKVA